MAKKTVQLVFADSMLDICFYTLAVHEQLVVELGQFEGPNTENMILACNETIKEFKRITESYKQLRREAETFRSAS